LRNFIAYHNAQKEGSCTAIPEPRVKTGKSVSGLEGVTVWLISGEGKKDKSYYLAATFIAKKCELNLYPGTGLDRRSGKNLIFRTVIRLQSVVFEGLHR
jgi:hypothetical protein